MVRADVRRAVEKAQGRLRLWRRARARRTQERERHLVGGIVVCEKRRERRIGKKRAEERIDDRVEDEVAHLRRARKERRVAEDHVVKLVHHEHEEMLVCPAMRLDEVPVQKERRRVRTGDGRRFDLF